jgi:FKBP-type peptidyl-prolyl cis-trans isomerase
MTRVLPWLLACLLLTVVAAGCGGDDAAAPQATAAPPPFDPKAVSTDLKVKPAVPAPSGEPPAGLQKVDIVKGKGKRARPGDTVAVQYVGVSWSTGEQFDASWDRGTPISFPLGQGRVIKGWDEGVAGMRVGGRRVLVIPPDLGYGDQSPTPAIRPGETLVFVVDLKRVG